MFAHPMYRGRVTIDQLCAAFEDTKIFKSLHNPFSLVHKLLLSPFFREIPLTHYERLDLEIMKDNYVLTEANYISQAKH